MSSPTEGYVDPTTGQFIPGSFADQLDLPGPAGSDPNAIANANYNLAMEKAKGNTINSKISSANARIKTLQGQLKANPKWSATKKASVNNLIKQQQQIVTDQTKLLNTSKTTQGTLQNKVYEASGQYDKLLTGANRDAYAALTALFKNYGLESLAPKIYDYAKQGYGADTISLLLQDTQEYKTRFAANAIRTKAGLPVLSPAEYLSTEQAYRQIMQDAGLPKGFYDSPTDFTNFIANDTSPTEVKGRVDLASQKLYQSNPSALQALQQLYGVDKSMITAYFLDSTKALPLLQKQANAAEFGSEALKRGLTLDKNDLEDFVGAGLSLGQVSQGFQAVAESLPNIQAIAARFGAAPFTQQELERDLVGGFTSNTGTPRRKDLGNQERALFQGNGGAQPASLSSGYQQV